MYGIPNCDTIKKARKWLTENDVEYIFHNYKKDGVDEAALKQWIKTAGWEILLNRRGTTWRKLDDNIKDNIDEKSAIEVMMNNPSAIKRPVLVDNKTILVGFDENEYEKLR